MTFQGGERLLPPHSISGRYKFFAVDLQNAWGFTVKYRRGARQGAQPGTNSLLEFGLGKCNRSGRKFQPEGRMHAQPRDFRISTPITGLKAWKRHLQTCPVLGCMEFPLQEEFCRREDRTQRQDKAKQGSAPLPGTQLLLQPKKKTLKPPPLLPKAVPKKAAHRFWLLQDLCLKPAQTFIPGLWENPKSF